MITFNELCEKLENVEETILVEILELNSMDIVERFQDIIEDKYDYLREDFNNDDD